MNEKRTILRSEIVLFSFTELPSFVNASLRPYEALRSATLRAAETVSVNTSIASVEPGKLADIVIINGDPLTNIHDALKGRAGHPQQRHTNY